MKVLYFVHTYLEKNGISVHVLNISKSLPKGIGHKIVFGKGCGLPFFSSLRFPIIEFWQGLRTDCDIIHIHGYGNFFSFFGAILALLKRKPLIWTIHGYPEIHGPRRLFYHFYRHLMAPLIFFAAKRIISVSKASVPILRKQTKKKITVMPNGVDLNLFKPKKSYKKANSVCFIGRLDKDKGAARMLECSSFPIMFIGPEEGNEKQNLQRLGLRLKRKVLFRKASFEAMPHEYEHCRYVVLPSKYEGFPLTLLESAAMKRPFVSTDVGEVKRILTRLFKKPEKFILRQHLQQKIWQLEKMDLEKEMESARKKAHAYSWKAIAKKLSLIYKEALN